MDIGESSIDRLLKARAEIDEALRRHKSALTILFTDVVGSTAYFDLYGDTTGLLMMHRHADLASKTVTEFQGRMIKTIGDSVMAEFPEPPLAVRAAIEIQRRVRAMNRGLDERQRLQLRIGINTGIGFRQEGDVMGNVVNVAARITKRTGPSQILISRGVHDALVPEVDARCTWLGQVTIDGKTEKEDIFEVVWTDNAANDVLRAHAAALAIGEPASAPTHAPDLNQKSAAEIPLMRASEDTPHAAPAALSTRYEILKEIGRGGMGIVYKARDRETGEMVALKVLKGEIASDQTMMERFKNELRLARKITHKNVCRIYEFNRADNTAYISMELVEGESLRSVLIVSGGIGIRKGLHIVQQVCSALHEAHTQGVIHRDLKPENILIARDGTVKLVDFGIARAVQAGATSVGSLIGTPAYMSPEQAQSMPVDARSDIYSLGLVIFEMFCGQPPFKANTEVALLMKHVHETPPNPRQLEPDLPERIERAILKCLEKTANARFETVQELASALS